MEKYTQNQLRIIIKCLKEKCGDRNEMKIEIQRQLQYENNIDRKKLLHTVLQSLDTCTIESHKKEIKNKTFRLFFNHHFNPLHVYTKLIKICIPKKYSLIISKGYERFYKLICKIL